MIVVITDGYCLIGFYHKQQIVHVGNQIINYCFKKESLVV